MLGIRAGHNLKLSRFPYIFQFGIIEPKHVGSYRKCNITAFTWIEGNAFKSFQFLNRTNQRGLYVVSIELHNLGRFKIAGIGDIDSRLD